MLGLSSGPLQALKVRFRENSRPPYGAEFRVDCVLFRQQFCIVRQQHRTRRNIRSHRTAGSDMLSPGPDRAESQIAKSVWRPRILSTSSIGKSTAGDRSGSISVGLMPQ